MQITLLSALFASTTILNLVAAAPIASSDVILTSEDSIALFEKMFNVSSISSDFPSFSVLDDDADEFFSFYQNELAVRNQYLADYDVSTTAVDRQALAWDMANMFFTGTGALEGCVFHPGADFNHKMALCGINLTGMLFGLTSMMVKLADAGWFELNPANMKTMLSTIGFNVVDNDYAAFGTMSNIDSLREKLPFVFEHIDAFRETETFAGFSKLNIQVDVETFDNSVDEHSFYDWVFKVSTGMGIGSTHGLELTLTANQYLFRMMANSRYVNLPTKVVKNIFKLLKTEYPLIKKGQIAEFIFTVISTASQHSAEYATRMLTLFSKLSEEDHSSQCSTRRYGFGIKDPKQNNISVMNIKGHVNC
ncbi:uncharacterized protein HGUI_01208 [Hanseniaspora guilliermondii]|uniref:Uncharacterized protein n=1 Tax=Hanseniaspora guilliermondii TaxID=56406 RepID=A0A1L0AY49_9ASCO|nr:uncharacterized protein HGUI_01208 [Hanseniaspora guilliermondii]